MDATIAHHAMHNSTTTQPHSSLPARHHEMIPAGSSSKVIGGALAPHESMLARPTVPLSHTGPTRSRAGTAGRASVGQVRGIARGRQVVGGPLTRDAPRLRRSNLVPPFQNPPPPVGHCDRSPQPFCWDTRPKHEPARAKSPADG